MFILLLQKCDNSCKYMDDWEEFNETLLPEKEDFYGHLNMEDTNNADYAHTKRFFFFVLSGDKDFEYKDF